VIPNPRYLDQPKYFWANVRSISETIGYSARKQGRVKVPTLAEITSALQTTGVGSTHIAGKNGHLTQLGRTLSNYFEHRASILNDYVKNKLMDVEEARAIFNKLRRQLSPSCPLPMNKQRGDKKAPAYLTGIVNMLIEQNAAGFPCDYDPRGLTTVTRDRAPLRTLARRIDGAFTSVINPIAVWEVKEYYYTTTFGSRVADGIYETLLDGMELEELWRSHRIRVKHYLIIDARYTWWDCGRSYLCRIFDMLHMRYVDEVLFGREVLERLPHIVKEWVSIARSRGLSPHSP